MSAPLDSTLSLSDILTRQQELEDEARETLPGDTTVCSFDEGYVRQAVYACKTCNPDTAAGFCFACSISCHGDHEIIELFPKRAFRCDCRTSKFSTRPCSLLPEPSSSKLPPNELNSYDHNFLGRFCICDADYDPQEEAENMVQCISCEDWFHESHLNLIPPPPPTSSTSTSTSSSAVPPPSDPLIASSSNPTASIEPPSLPQPAPIIEEDEPTGPTPLLTEDDYTNILCERCVLAHPVLVDHLGSNGFMTVVRSSSEEEEESAWEVLGKVEEQEVVMGGGTEAEVQSTKEEGSSSRKHDLDASSDAPSSKKIRLSSPPRISTSVTILSSSTSTCSLPPLTPHLVSLVAARRAADATNHGFGTGRLDLFLPENFREKWCRCEKHLPQLSALPYLLEEEETWEPADEAPAPDVESLLLASLSSLPREATINVITGFQELTAGLTRYLKKASEEGGAGKVIGRREVEEFFEKWKAGER
ncbi:hypothetical protein BDY24DRAFT_412497 [Mrakia frigida]|uniref:uncharacterized protein n=1 Tax=Mrakia frigida TaxID=29902 RepID=UPI003FCBF012